MTSFDRINSSSIDTQKELNFIFNGKKYTGFQGDTLASALIANGIKLIARSFKYHRPRGIISCGSQEPNGLIELIHKDYEANGRLRLAYVSIVLNEAKEKENKTTLRNQLFIGKIHEVLGYDKTIELLKQCYDEYPL